MASSCFILLSILCCPIIAPSPTQQEPECIVYNGNYMECMFKSLVSPGNNYSLHYRYTQDSKALSECKRYIQQQELNIGCNFTKNELKNFSPFQVQVNRSYGDWQQLIASSELQLQDKVKPNPPVNLTIRNISRNQLMLSWNAEYNNNCLEFLVRFKSNTDTNWMEQNVNNLKFSYPSMDPEKQYTFQVRSKINKYCGTSKIWSEWSNAITWGKNTTILDASNPVFPTQTLVTSVVSSLLIIVLIILLIRRERVWLIIVPNIPNPSKNFEELFQTHKGNFPEWAGMSKDIVDSFTPSYNETLCYVSEEPLPERGGGETGLCFPPETKSQPVSSTATDLLTGNSQQLMCIQSL
uniref:Cytokine receptor common subunit gamma n=1 Tax=Geotrypetes seraphini TaxID=260995 RepID=A0A6P8QXK4_GEOSA|nr:cytokine receptor common subunit gamma [Geotrypetes seraphini]XP_033802149.1 cytokine receptor common subunit gamma [Geotrypetes seraphini]XP_033802150.1 cytokine receptor common subunit gamma [Geotrypetes seraphini]